MMRGKRSVRKNTSKAVTSARRLRWRAAAGRALSIVAAAIGIPTLALGCILAHDLITQGDYTRIRFTDISGTQRLSRQEILDQAAIPEALNLLGVNIEVVRRRLLAHPWVAEASVSRRFPDRLVIDIREQQPVAQVAMADQWYLANAAGAFFVAGEAPRPDLPVLSGITCADLTAEGRLPNALWRTVMAATAHFAARGNASRSSALKRITYDRDIGVSIQATAQLGTIRLGPPPVADALMTAERVAAYLSSSGHATGLATIDMRNPNRIVVAPLPSGEGREDTHEENKHAA